MTASQHRTRPRGHGHDWQGPHLDTRRGSASAAQARYGGASAWAQQGPPRGPSVSSDPNVAQGTEALAPAYARDPILELDRVFGTGNRDGALGPLRDLLTEAFTDWLNLTTGSTSKGKPMPERVAGMAEKDFGDRAIEFLDDYQLSSQEESEQESDNAAETVSLSVALYVDVLDLLIEFFPVHSSIHFKRAELAGYGGGNRQRFHAARMQQVHKDLEILQTMALPEELAELKAFLIEELLAATKPRRRDKRKLRLEARDFSGLLREASGEEDILLRVRDKACEFRHAGMLFHPELAQLQLRSRALMNGPEQLGAGEIPWHIALPREMGAWYESSRNRHEEYYGRSVGYGKYYSVYPFLKMIQDGVMQQPAVEVLKQTSYLGSGGDLSYLTSSNAATVRHNFGDRVLGVYPRRDPEPLVWPWQEADSDSDANR